MNELEDFIDKHGGFWSPEGYPDYPVEDWKTEVANGDTRLGYWECAYNKSMEKN